DFCIDNTYSYSYLSFGGYIRGKALMDGYWNRVAERNAPDTSPYRAGFAQFICVADTDADAERLYAQHAHYFYNRCLHVFPGFADAPGYRTIKTIQKGILNQYAPTKIFEEVPWGELLESARVIAGSPETVRQRMEELIKSLRVGHVFCLLHTGNQTDEKTRHSSRLFAERVMPHLRDLWPEWSDDDRWWIHPLEQRAQPAPLAGVPV